MAGTPRSAASARPAPTARRTMRTRRAASRGGGPKRLLQLCKRAPQRREGPEVLRLQVWALERPRQVEELQVVLRRALAAAVVREDAVLHALLEVRQDLLLELRRQVLQQPELLALRDDRGRILVDLAVDPDELLDEHRHGGLVLVEEVLAREKRLVARLHLAQRQHEELARRLLHHEVLVRGVQDGSLDGA